MGAPVLGGTSTNQRFTESEARFGMFSRVPKEVGVRKDQGFLRDPGKIFDDKLGREGPVGLFLVAPQVAEGTTVGTASRCRCRGHSIARMDEASVRETKVGQRGIEVRNIVALKTPSLEVGDELRPYGLSFAFNDGVEVLHRFLRDGRDVHTTANRRNASLAEHP